MANITFSGSDMMTEKTKTSDFDKVIEILKQSKLPLPELVVLDNNITEKIGNILEVETCINCEGIFNLGVLLYNYCPDCHKSVMTCPECGEQALQPEKNNLVVCAECDSKFSADALKNPGKVCCEEKNMLPVIYENGRYYKYYTVDYTEGVCLTATFKSGSEKIYRNVYE